DGVRDCSLLELPRGETCALEERPGLVDENALEQTAIGRGTKSTDRRAVAAGGEAAGVAVGERAGSGLEELRGVRGHHPAARDLLLVERASVIRGRLLPHCGEGPGEVDRRRPRGGEDSLGFGEVLALERSERHSVRGGDADRRRPAD